MLLDEDEALACLKVLVALAKSDGKVLTDEKKSIAAAISSFALPVGVSVDGLLAETVDVGTELAKITSKEAKEQLYRSAYFLAHADGTAAPQERALLEKIDLASAPSDELRSQMTTLVPPANSRASIFEALRGVFRSK
jgi:uncharacterized membrane protein YebE (DUF533 family)